MVLFYMYLILLILVVHDLLDMKLNRVQATVEERGQKLKKSYDIDVNDFFWMKNAGYFA